MMQFYIIFGELLDQQESDVLLPRLAESMKAIRQDEQSSLLETGKFLNSAGLAEQDISSLLSANRSFSLSLRQITLSVKDLVLTTEESDTWDHTF